MIEQRGRLFLEDKEDDEHELDLLYRRRFSRNANPVVKPPKPPRRKPEKWERRIELDDPFDDSVVGKEVKVVYGKGKGEIGVISRVHNGMVFVDTKRYFDMEKSPFDVRAKIDEGTMNEAITGVDCLISNKKGSWIVPAKTMEEIEWQIEDGAMHAILELNDGTEIELVVDQDGSLKAQGEDVEAISQVKFTPIQENQWNELLKIVSRKQN